MEIELKKVKLTKSIFDQLPWSSNAKLRNVVEVYGYVSIKNHKYILAKADAVFKMRLYTSVSLINDIVVTSYNESLGFANAEEARNWINDFAQLKAKAEAIGQVFL